MADLAAAFLQGAALNAGLIVAIGAQNAFVLAQGLSRRFVWRATLICGFCDTLLLVAGVAFAGAAQTAFAGAAKTLLAAGALYLLWFGGRALRACRRGESLSAAGGAPQTARGVVAVALALSLLNPHAILDMTVIFGGVSAQFPPAQKIAFAAGGVCMSFLWFFGLGFGARKFARHLNKPAAWRIINGIIALTMFAVALSLLRAIFI